MIGLDGLNFDLIDRFLPSEVMPTLHHLLQTGASGPLRSVLPTHSAAAWASFMTGQTPAGHGVTEFMVPASDGRYRHVKPATTSTFWHILGRYGYRGGVFNFPVTFPPDAVHGWLVSGMLSPDLERATYPTSLATILRQRFPDYLLDVEWKLYAQKPTVLLSLLTAMVRQRGEVIHYLLAHEPLDYLALAFIATDRAQHALWQFLDPTHPNFDEAQATALRPFIHDFYHTLDQVVAQIIAMVDEETAVILLSDHGFKAAAWQFHVNDWLAQQGWLVYTNHNRRLEQWLRQLDTPRVRQWRRRFLPDVSRHVPTLASGGNIRWSQTTAFCPWHFQQGIRLNVEGRDPHGIVKAGGSFEHLCETMMASLKALRHPQTGELVVSAVYRACDWYNEGGDSLAEMPDIVFDLHPSFALGVYRQRLFAPTEWASGDHSLMGFVALAGAGIEPGQIESARLIDMAPTLLRLLNVPIPATMHGRPLSCVTPIVSEERSPIETTANETVDDHHLAIDEEAKLVEQLRNLGYM